MEATKNASSSQKTMSMEEQSARSGFLRAQMTDLMTETEKAVQARGQMAAELTQLRWENVLLRQQQSTASQQAAALQVLSEVVRELRQENERAPATATKCDRP